MSSKKPKLYYCNTIYGIDFISDINPLILERYKNNKILVLCAREGQIERIKQLAPDKIQNVTFFGWWEVREFGLLNEYNTLDLKFLYGFDVVTILDKDRIHEAFIPLLQMVESLCK